MRRLISSRIPIMALLLIAITLGPLFAVAPVLAAERDAKVTFVHAINGVKIKMAKELPVDIEIFRNGKLHHTIRDFKFHQRLSMELPAGTYKFVVVNHATDKMIVTKTVVIKGGSTVRVRAMLNAKNVPALNVKTK